MPRIQKEWKLGGDEAGKVSGNEIWSWEFGRVGENVNKARRPGCFAAGKV